MGFLKDRPGVFCQVQSRSSQWIADWLVTRRLDVGLISSRIDNPYIATESLMEHPLVCIMARDHELARKRVIRPKDLDGTPFISFDPESYTGKLVAPLFEAHNVTANIVLVASVSPTLSEFVAAGLGVSLVHPLMVSGMQDRIAVRRFEPAVQLDFQLCRLRDSRNTDLVDAFVQQTRATAKRISRDLLNAG
jgi:DNA-binding transcriptional LysR family regulator